MTKHTFADPLQAFAFYTECALATVEGLPKRTSNSDRRRFQVIADDMVRHCRLFGAQPSRPYTAWGTPRLNELLRKAEPQQSAPSAG